MGNFTQCNTSCNCRAVRLCWRRTWRGIDCIFLAITCQTSSWGFHSGDLVGKNKINTQKVFQTKSSKYLLSLPL
jgi:hypothetical protein